MKNRKHQSLLLLAALAGALATNAWAREKIRFQSPEAYRSLSSEIDAGAIQQTVRALSGFGSRVSG